MKAVRLGSYSNRSTIYRHRRASRAGNRRADRPLFVAATDVARGDTAVIVAAAGLELAFGQHFDRRAFHKPLRSTRTSWRRPGVIGRYVLSAIVYPHSPVVTSIEWPSSRVMMARLESLRRARMFLKTLSSYLLRTCVLTALTFTRNSFSTASLISRFGSVARHLEHHLIVLGHERRLLRDDGERG